MDLRYRKLETVKEEGWHIVPNAWWQTSYESVSWAYSPDDAAENNTTSGRFRGSVFGASRTSCDLPRPRHVGSGDLVLSENLSGVHCAVDALLKYEMDVGFSPEKLNSKPRADLSVQIEDEALARGKEMWEAYAEALISGVDNDPTMAMDATLENFARDAEVSRTPSPSSSQGGLHRSTSTLSSVDLTDSDLSFNSSSLPSTPKRKNAEVIVEVKDASLVKADHRRYVLSGGRPLNAAASSFVPSFIPSKADSEPFSFTTPTAPKSKPSPPPVFADFTFPTLAPPPLPTVAIKKDEHGFYSEAEVAAPVPQSQQETCTFLPPFLKNASRRKVPASKTRALVDRLRSSHNNTHSPVPNAPLYDLNLLDERVTVSEDDMTHNSGVSSPSSQEDDEDGWINVGENEKSSKESKARRTRDLFLALTKRRSDSTPPSQNETMLKDGHQEIEIPMTTSPISSTSPLPSTDDGWIDGSTLSVAMEATPQRRADSRVRSHRRRRSSHANPSPAPNPPSQYISPPTRAPGAVPHTSYHPQAPIYPSLNPASYFYPASIMSPAAYASYMQQLQLMQMQMRRGGGNTRRTTAPTATEWFQYPTAGTPFTTANTLTPLVASPASATRRDSLW
ncbi:hypothetical protein H0H87_002921 [Tephrocybe sp. NHM501043]|nr:hypothetical protein H0H87_002921 [Tephrocybe sp. NHM501043]